jgi:predicted  nucleic acid-binding Zn-ribbon protein
MKKILLAVLLKLGIEISNIKTQIKKMAADQQQALDKAKELSDKVDALQATIDAEQTDIQNLVANNAQVISDLTKQRDDLQAIVDAGGQAADFQPVIDAMDSTIAKVQSANDDVATTV